MILFTVSEAMCPAVCVQLLCVFDLEGIIFTAPGQFGQIPQEVLFLINNKTSSGCCLYTKAEKTNKQKRAKKNTRVFNLFSFYLFMLPLAWLKKPRLQKTILLSSHVIFP